MRFKALSLFSSVGIAETYFEKHGIDVVLANELLPERAKFHEHLYPKTEMVKGDITDPKILKYIIDKSVQYGVDFILATPPCQGMSTAGKMDENDPRNRLIVETVDIINAIKPKFAIIENVPEQLRTKIFVNGEYVLIPTFLKENLSNYIFNNNTIVNAMNYGVPQSRERNVFLLTRKDMNIRWEFGQPQKPITLRESIGNLPSLDPFVSDISESQLVTLFPDYYNKLNEGRKISKWHYPPAHKLRHVEAMLHTPEGRSAWDNDIYYPKLKDGSKSKGYKNTYKRQWWDKPAYTVTRYTSRLGSQENGHPGRMIVDDGTEVGRKWSEPRVFSIYELLVVSSLPTDWNIPEWASSNLIRESIGEGVPPKLIEAAISRITDDKEIRKMRIE